MDINELLDQAFEYLEGDIKNVSKAIGIFEPLAKEGNVVAQFALGEIYWNGNDQIERNDELALYWYSLAGENGHALVQLWLGNNYCIGIRSEPDAEKAVYWYSKAANNDVVLAQYHLGICYHTGWGVDKDDVKAFFWEKKAANHEFLDAELYVSEAYKIGIGVDENIVEYQKLSKSILNRYEKKAYTIPDVAGSLSRALLTGYGLEKNAPLAVDILSSDCLKDNVELMLVLANCYEKGEGVERDVHKAYQILDKISESSIIAKNKMKLLSLMYDCVN